MKLFNQFESIKQRLGNFYSIILIQLNLAVQDEARWTVAAAAAIWQLLCYSRNFDSRGGRYPKEKLLNYIEVAVVSWSRGLLSRYSDNLSLNPPNVYSFSAKMFEKNKKMPGWPFCEHFVLGCTWIAKWLWTLVCCTMPWAMSLSLGGNKLFIVPKPNINALFGLFELISLFFCQIFHVKQKIQRKRFF